MINVEIIYSKDNREVIEQLVVDGHSSLENKELCASVSTLGYTFLYSLRMLTNLKVDSLIDDGFFKLVIKGLDKKDELLYNHLCSFYKIGLKTLSKEYVEQLRIEERQNGIEKR